MKLIQETETEVEDEVDLLMSTDIVNAQISTKTISFARAQVGWFFKQYKTVQYDYIHYCKKVF